MHFVKINFINNNEFKEITNRWWLDGPKQGIVSADGKSVSFCGWIICLDTSSTVSVVVAKSDNSQTEFPLNARRGDAIRAVLKKEPAFNCGFRFEFQLNIGVTRFGFKINGKTYFVLELSVAPPAKVIKGGADYLFLANDINRSTDQFTGELRISTTAISSWNSYLRNINKKFTADGIKACLLIAPAKEEIFPDFYPHPRGLITPIDEFMDKVRGGITILFPLEEIAKERELTYSRIDSHWTDYGAKIAANSLLKNLGLEEYASFLPSEFRVRSSCGDLGIKIVPPVFGPVLSLAKQSLNSKETFNNYVNNNGRIRVMEDPNAPLHKTLVIFGDSFSINFARVLTTVFQRVVYTYTGAGLDTSIIDFECPNFVVVQSNQRFIVNPPSENYDIWHSIHSKLIRTEKIELQNLATRMMAHVDGSSSFYAKAMLDLTKKALELHDGLKVESQT